MYTTKGFDPGHDCETGMVDTCLSTLDFARTASTHAGPHSTHAAPLHHTRP
jgi:hypothetical protein